MTNRKILLAFASAAAAIASVALTPVAAQTSTASQEASQLPSSIRAAAIATRSDSEGQIAGTRIMRTDHYVVYMRTDRGCGSGGCRAQIWTLDNGRPVQKDSITVGFLPIVLLPHLDNGMPRLGVRIETLNGREAILPIAYDGQNYSDERYERLVTPTSGLPILTEAMLRDF